MIQRKQSLFLLVAVIAYVACLFFPIASIEPKTMGAESMVYNLGIVNGDAGISIEGTCVPLFILIAISTLISFATIFFYKNRPLQITLCTVSMLFSLLWYIDYALIYLGIVPMVNLDGAMEVKFAACLPFVSIVLTAMAKKGVKDDEKLIKAADRIR